MILPPARAPPIGPTPYHPNVATSARLRRLLIGRAIRTEQGGQELGRIRAIAAMASDTLSSNAYATQEILIVLAAGGFGLYRYGPAVAVAVVVIFTAIVAAYRHTVRQYPGGGADYQVAAKNIGPRSAALVGSAMLIDFCLTLAVSVAAIVDLLISVAPSVADHQELWGIGLVAVLALLGLRGRSGFDAVLHVGAHLFVVSVLIMAVTAGLETVFGETPRAASAGYELADPGTSAAGLVLALVIARAFSSGSVAVTGVEAIGTGVPVFRKPRGDNAAAALVIIGVVSMVLFACVTWLALLTGVRVVADHRDLAGDPSGQPQHMVIVQIADAVFGNPVGIAAVVFATALVLLAAGLSAIRSFTALSSVIANDGLLPRQFMARGDRFVHSNGIILLGVAAGLLIYFLGASLTALIQLYVVGAFLALTIGQFGMVRHWNRRLAGPMTDAEHAAAVRARAIAAVAAGVSAVVLTVVLFSKLATGAWIVVVLIPALALAMGAVRAHYANVAYELAPEDAPPAVSTHQVIALILVARIHKPALRAVAYARATRPTSLEAVTVAVDDHEAEQLAVEWESRGLRVPLRVLPSPFREIDTPVLDYVAALRDENPDSLLTIYVPEYVVTHWWEEALHNQSAARLKRRLMSLQNVVVVSVPWQTAAPDTVVRGEADELTIPSGGGVTGMTGALPRIEPGRPPR